MIVICGRGDCQDLGTFEGASRVIPSTHPFHPSLSSLTLSGQRLLELNSRIAL